MSVIAAQEYSVADSARILLGYDSRERVAYAVAVASIRRHASVPVTIAPILLGDLQGRGWYTRPTPLRAHGLWDSISDAPMSTEHAIARFFTPLLCGFDGWALSADCDILARADVAELFALADPRYAVMVVQHQHIPTDATKMDGQIQTAYQRKNWSSVVLWNCAHPAHLVLRPGEFGILNRWPGRDLHAFKWLKDDEIGVLPVAWNYLVGVTPATFEVDVTHHEGLPRILSSDPPVKIAHFTLGTPDMPGYEDGPFAEEWLAIADDVTGRHVVAPVEVA